MYKKTITYTDYNGVERTEDYYFNLTEAELRKMEITKDRSMSSILVQIINANDGPAIMRLFENLLLVSYGEKSDDGRHFMKSDTIRERFQCSEAYNVIFNSFFDGDHAENNLSDFVNGIMPAKLMAEAKKQGLLDDPKKAISMLKESK